MDALLEYPDAWPLFLTCRELYSRLCRATVTLSFRGDFENVSATLSISDHNLRAQCYNAFLTPYPLRTAVVRSYHLLLVHLCSAHELTHSIMLPRWVYESGSIATYGFFNFPRSLLIRCAANRTFHVQRPEILSLIKRGLRAMDRSKLEFEIHDAILTGIPKDVVDFAVSLLDYTAPHSFAPD